MQSPSSSLQTPQDSAAETMAAFSDLIDAQLADYRGGFDPGERVEAVVLDTGGDFVTLEVHVKREGWMDRAECMDENGDLTVAPGDRLDVWFAGMHKGVFLFTLRLSSVALVQRSLRDAFARDMPVEGVVRAEVTGGFQVDVGSVRGFCPYSQIDRVREDDSAAYLGRRMAFRVTELDESGRNVILSHRDVQEREREAQLEVLRASLSVGDLRDGVVTRIADFGVFVDLGGTEGLVPLSELSWQRRVDAHALVRPGETVRVAVREIDWERNRISLSLREAQGDPWEQVESRFQVGGMVRGRVTRLERFGAFVEVAPGIEGLAPISLLGAGRRLNHAREALAEGQEQTFRVESIDGAARRMSLRPLADGDASESADLRSDGHGDDATGFGSGSFHGGSFAELLDGIR